MTRHTLHTVMGGLGTCASILLVVVASGPGSALAQVPPQRAVSPAVALTPPAVPTPSPSQRPMRYRLRTGEVMIGTELSEDAESITVATSSGVVRIARSNLISVVPARGYPGRGMIIAGSIIFGTLYVLPLFGEVTSDVFEPLVLLPIAGPFILAYQCYDSAGFLAGLCAEFLALWGIGQAVGVALLIAGIVRGATASDDRQRVSRLEVVPVIARDYEGLALRMTF